MNIGDEIEIFTAKISGFEEKRDYVSLSNIIKPVDEMVNDYLNGYTATHEQKLKYYKGYQMEKDLLMRMKLVYGERLVTPVEVSYGLLFKGHPDFTLDDFPGDCKSVNLDDHLPKAKLPAKVYWQINAYLFCTEKEKGLIVYESRESGKIQSRWVYPNPSIQEQIAEKIHQAENKLTHV